MSALDPLLPRVAIAPRRSGDLLGSVAGLAKIADMGVVVGSGLLAYAMRVGRPAWPEAPRYADALLAAAALTLLVFGRLSLYRQRPHLAATMVAGRVLTGWAIVLSVLMSIGFLSATGAGFSRLWFLYWAGCGGAGLLCVRSAMKGALAWLHRHGIGRRRIALLGPPERSDALVASVQQHPCAGVELVQVPSELALGGTAAVLLAGSSARRRSVGDMADARRGPTSLQHRATGCLLRGRLLDSGPVRISPGGVLPGGDDRPADGGIVCAPADGPVARAEGGDRACAGLRHRASERTAHAGPGRGRQALRSWTGVIPADTAGLGWPPVRIVEVPQHAGPRCGDRRTADQPRGSTSHALRRLPATHQPGRIAAIPQRASGAHGHRRAAPACAGAQRSISGIGAELPATPAGQAGHHRLGAGQWPARRDRYAGKDAQPRSTRSRLHPALVALAGYEHHRADLRDRAVRPRRLLNSDPEVPCTSLMSSVPARKSSSWHR
ncbi:membrane hypothetical protein [Xanthomonas citri pv. citri]|nr:membrane hypothetical protein [Xanthomonas citri pv. citri]